MSPRLDKVARRIRTELQELDRVVRKIEDAWQRCRESADTYYLDSVALNLHGLYSGFERIFEIIASHIDADKPSGENWHQVLLTQMSLEVEGLRPAVLSAAVCQQLDDLRGFRHIVRNVYTFHFDPVRMEGLVKKVPGMFKSVTQELLSFADFLEGCSSD